MQSVYHAGRMQRLYTVSIPSLSESLYGLKEWLMLPAVAGEGGTLVSPGTEERRWHVQCLMLVRVCVWD